MAEISDRPWGEIQDSDYTPDQFCRAALIDLNPSGAKKVKDQCKLPVREPSGTLNRNGVHAAAQRIGQVDAPATTIRKAAEMLLRLYDSIGEQPPDSIKDLAR